MDARHPPNLKVEIAAKKKCLEDLKTHILYPQVVSILCYLIEFYDSLPYLFVLAGMSDETRQFLIDLVISIPTFEDVNTNFPDLIALSNIRARPRKIVPGCTFIIDRIKLLINSILKIEWDITRLAAMPEKQQKADVSRQKNKEYYIVSKIKTISTIINHMNQEFQSVLVRLIKFPTTSSLKFKVCTEHNLVFLSRVAMTCKDNNTRVTAIKQENNCTDGNKVVIFLMRPENEQRAMTLYKDVLTCVLFLVQSLAVEQNIVTDCTEGTYLDALD